MTRARPFAELAADGRKYKALGSASRRVLGEFHLGAQVDFVEHLGEARVDGARALGSDQRAEALQGPARQAAREETQAQFLQMVEDRVAAPAPIR